MFSDRTVIDPTKPAASRLVGTETAPVYALDLGFALGLTGRKSWHNLAPQVRAGVGVVTSQAADDTTGLKFGTPFAFSFGAGVKFVHRGAECSCAPTWRERLFKQKYPDAYYRTASDNTAVLTDASAIVLDAPRLAHGRRLVPVRPLSRSRRRDLQPGGERWRATTKTFSNLDSSTTARSAISCASVSRRTTASTSTTSSSTVDEGAIALSGRVGTEGERRIAEHILTDVLGVQEFRNDLVIDPIRRAESPLDIDEHLADEERTSGLLLGDRAVPLSPEAEHLADEADADLEGHDRRPERDRERRDRGTRPRARRRRDSPVRTPRRRTSGEQH